MTLFEACTKSAQRGSSGTVYAGVGNTAVSGEEAQQQRERRQGPLKSTGKPTKVRPEASDDNCGAKFWTFNENTRRYWRTHSKRSNQLVGLPACTPNLLQASELVCKRPTLSGMGGAAVGGKLALQPCGEQRGRPTTEGLEASRACLASLCN